MRSRRLIWLFLPVLVAGCTSPARREADAEARGYERGYRRAVQDQYWILQRQQRPALAGSSTKP